MENIEENLEQYKKYQQALKSDLAKLLIILKRFTTEDNQKEKLNTRKNLLKEEIEMVGLMIDTYEIRIKVKKLDKEYKELVSRNLEGEFVDDLMKSNRFEIELLNRQDKENSDIIKELIKEQSEKKMKYREQFEMFDRDRAIMEAQMENMLSKTPKGSRKDRMIELKKKIEVEHQMIDSFAKTRKMIQEIVKTDEEYKVLLERKKKSEPVKGLIKQNRNYAKVLAKKDRKNIEKLKKWQQSEEGRKWFEDTEKWLRMNELNKTKSEEKLKVLEFNFEMEKKTAEIEGVKRKLKEKNMEYIKLVGNQKSGELVEDLIKRTNYELERLKERDLELFVECNKCLEAEKERRVNQFPKRKREQEKEKRLQRKLHASTQLKKLLDKVKKNLQEMMKNEEEYKILSQRKKAGESVEDTIKQNRSYAEVLRINYIENSEEAKEWVRMNPDCFQDSVELQHFLTAFGLEDSFHNM